MSEREAVQLELARALSETRRADGQPKYDAPYGVLEGTRKVGRGGYARTITFGVRRVLDAEVLIFRPDHIVVRGEGAIAYQVTGTYRSFQDVRDALCGPWRPL